MSVDTSTLTTPKNGEITDTTYVFSCDPYLTEADQEAAIADAGMDKTYLPIEENAYLILGGDTSYAIPYCADEPERAMMVLNAIYSQPDLYNTLIYGIEGEDYTKNADGTITTSYVGASPTADDSYGIEVAKLAGLPGTVTRRAHEVLRTLEASAPKNKVEQMDFDALQEYSSPAVPSEMMEKLEALDVETLTPIEALNFLYELKKTLSGSLNG